MFPRLCSGNGRTFTIGYVRNQRIKEECPTQWIKQCFFELIELEVLVTHTLAVHANALNSQDSVFFAQPATVHLVVWYNPQEQNAEKGGQKSGGEENDLPRLDSCASLTAANCNTVGKTATKDLYIVRHSNY
jgi:hypothetical protein